MVIISNNSFARLKLFIFIEKFAFRLENKIKSLSLKLKYHVGSRTFRNWDNYNSFIIQLCAFYEIKLIFLVDD